MMLHWFAILTPILLLGVIALLGFVGCDRVFGLYPVLPPSPATNIGQNQIVAGNTANGTAQATLSLTEQANLIVVTVVWPSGAGTLASLIVPGGTFQTIRTDSWSGYNVQTSYASAVPAGSAITVQAALSAGSSPSPWYLCVAVYNGAEQTNPTYSASSLSSVNTGTIAPIAFSAQEDGDVIYSIAIAQTSGGSFGAFTGQLAPGATFIAEQSLGFLLIQDQQVSAAGSVSVTADATGTNTGRWYLLAMGINHG
jgi:hypothetical protein